MTDRLRLLLNRPFRDGDRGRLFALAVTVIAAAALVFSQLDDAAPTTASSHPPARGNAPTGGGAPIVATPLPQAPGEESTPPPDVRGSRINVERSKRAARRFLAGYLRFAYGHGSARRIPSATPELLAALDRQPPRVPARERRRRPRVELLQSNGVGRDRADLAALIDDGARRYSLPLQLTNTPTGWLVTSLEG